ncbi:RNA replicase polyprotein [Striga asiatica]|uniref:RNA replicase polyprotein n=1 Tax=Striga asiatica TaxID=4170 RepID=A0A5A7PSK9_STRAF|nr:RNA replicase polyprotein [Striga asiatica]
MPMTNEVEAKISSRSQVEHKGPHSTNTNNNGTSNATTQSFENELVLYRPTSTPTEIIPTNDIPIHLEPMPNEAEDQPGRQMSESKGRIRKGVAQGKTTWRRNTQREGRLLRNFKDNSMELSNNCDQMT